MKPSNRSVPRRTQRPRGFSALELIIVLSLVSILAAMYVFNYNSDNSKAATLLNVTQEYANAMKRAKADMACYPNRMAALFDRSQANTSFCGINLTNQWNGRYAEVAPTNAAGAVLLNNVSNGVAVSIVNVVDAAGTRWRIQASGVPNDVLNRAVNVCNGGAANGRCIGTPGGSGSGTFEIEFDLT